MAEFDPMEPRINHDLPRDYRPEPALPSAASLVRSNNEAILYHEVQVDNILYGVQLRQYERRLANIAISCVAWTTIIVLSIIFILADNIQHTDTGNVIMHWQLLLILASLSSLIISVFALLNRKSLDRLQILTIINITIYLILASVFYSLQIKYQWIVAAAAFAAQMVISGIFLKDKKKILAIGLICLAPVAIALKADQVFGQTITWDMVLFLPMVFAGLFAILFVIFVLLAIRIRCQNPDLRLLIIGNVYKGFASLGISLSLSAILIRALVLDNCLSVAIPVIVYYIAFMVILVGCYRYEIALYHAKALVVAFLDAPPQRAEFQKINEPNIFFKLSSGWLTLNYSLVKEHPISNDELKSKKECVICLSDPALNVWFPCGHLSVCETCCQYLKDNSKLECVECKVRCTNIYHVIRFSQGRECESDYYWKVK